MKILVTGGAGFIGCNLIDHLLSFANNQVTCIDNLILGKKENLEAAFNNPNFKFYEIDLLNFNKVKEVFESERFELVYHLAANSDIRSSFNATDRDLNLTFLTTYNVLECMRLSAVKKILFTSSPTVYGNHDVPLNEQLQMNPESLYGASKLASEAYIRTFSSLYGIQAWILRLSNMVGGRATHGILFDFFNKITKSSFELEVLGNGSQTKPYMHVDELIDCMLFVLENANERFNEFNVGPIDAIKVSTIAELFIKHLGEDHKIRYTGGDRGWKGDIPKYQHNPKKISDLGWSPSLNSYEAVEKAIIAMKD